MVQIKHPGCTDRQKNFYYQPLFTVTLRADDADAMKALQEAIGHPGYIYHRGIFNATAKRNESRPCIAGVWKTKDAVNAVVALLSEFPLRAKKRLDFRLWKRAVLIRYGADVKNRDAKLLKLRLQLQQVKKYVE